MRRIRVLSLLINSDMLHTPLCVKKLRAWFCQAGQYTLTCTNLPTVRVCARSRREQILHGVNGGIKKLCALQRRAVRWYTRLNCVVKGLREKNCLKVQGCG